ncbi:phosphohistidine phosphatase SixA [Orbaceae bacterium ESL0721]|nr:phosphohistidine phosphatase SixA [Orbaceae bacterium ESL0721]
MKIYIMRHGEAAFSAPSDPERPLTDRGLKQALSAGHFLKAQGISIDLALVSPYLRAQQTLAEVASVTTIGRIETDSALTPSGNPEQVSLWIPTIGVENLLIVSHLPFVGYLVSELCPAVSPPMFATADIACVDLLIKNGSPVGTLEWIHHE